MLRKEKTQEIWDNITDPRIPQNCLVIGEKWIGKTHFLRCFPDLIEKKEIPYLFLYCSFPQGEIEIWNDKEKKWNTKPSLNPNKSDSSATSRVLKFIEQKEEKENYLSNEMVCLFDDFDKALKQNAVTLNDLIQLNKQLDEGIKVVLTMTVDIRQTYKDQFEYIQGSELGRWRKVRLELLINEDTNALIEHLAKKYSIALTQEQKSVVAKVAGPHPGQIQEVLIVIRRSKNLKTGDLIINYQEILVKDFLDSSLYSTIFIEKWEEIKKDKSAQSLLLALAATNELGGREKALYLAYKELYLTEDLRKIVEEQLSKKNFLLPRKGPAQIYSLAFETYIQSTKEYRDFISLEKDLSPHQQLHDIKAIFTVLSLSLLLSFFIFLVAVIILGPEFFWLSIFGWLPVARYIYKIRKIETERKIKHTK